jgi:hypothetical protein
VKVYLYRIIVIKHNTFLQNIPPVVIYISPKE